MRKETAKFYQLKNTQTTKPPKWVKQIEGAIKKLGST